MSARWPNAALLFVSGILSLATAEWVARWLLPPPQKVHIRGALNERSRRNLENEERFDIKVAENPEEARGYLYILTPAGRRIRANTHAVIENHGIGGGRRIELVTNSIGYRNREIGPKSGKRLLFLGDSITLGDYLPEAETFVRRVETMGRGHGRDWEAINAGVSGISLKNELAILVETGLALAPDVVIVGFYLNDFQESPGVFISNLPWLVRSSRILYYLFRGAYRAQPDSLALDPANLHQTKSGEDYHVALPKLYRRLIRKEEKMVARWKDAFVANLRARGETAAFYADVTESFDDWGGAWSAHMWTHVKPLFAELKRLSDDFGFRPVVLAFPVRQQVEADTLFNYPQQRLSQLSRELDMPYLDLLPVLRAEHRRGRGQLFYDHCHHTPEGNAVIAETVYRFLSEQL